MDPDVTLVGQDDSDKKGEDARETEGPHVAMVRPLFLVLRSQALSQSRIRKGIAQKNGE